MAANEKLTIIVPIYNKEKYIERCVESLLHQTLTDIKIILVDDGSTDHSLQICEQFEDNRIQVIALEHQGPIQARFAGVEKADTEYITFVDADDWVEQDAYECLLPYMEKKYDVVKYLMTLDYGNGKLVPYQNSYSEGDYDRTRIEKEIYPNMVWDDEKRRNGISSSLCDKLVKKEILEKSMLLATGLRYHFCEDSTISFPMFRWVNSLMITGKIVYHHCKEEQEVSSYLIDTDFFDNLYLWYKHLKNNVDFIPNALTQIEKIYIDAMEARNKAHYDVVEKLEYLFPYRKIPTGTSIVIWGCGNVGKSYIQQMKQSKYCNVLAVVDTKYEKYSENEVRNPKVIRELNPDYVVIAIYNESVISEITKDIIKMGLDKTQIISKDIE